MPKNIFELSSQENVELRKITKTSICFLPISIGQKYHEGEEWRETMRKVRDCFGAVVIVPVDGLHRYTEMMKNRALSEEEAEARAIRAGDDWLCQTEKLNKPNKKSNVPVIVSRWAEWTQTQEYLTSKNRIDQNYLNDTHFRTGVQRVIFTFLNGFFGKPPESTDDSDNTQLDLYEAVKFCERYLLEELAFVDMIKNGYAPPEISTFFSSRQLSDFLERQFFMAYPFGHHSTNKSVYSCFETLCSNPESRLSFINLSKPPKLSRQNKQVPSPTHVGNIPTFFPGQTLLVSKQDMSDQISSLQNSSAAIHCKEQEEKHSELQLPNKVRDISEESQALNEALEEKSIDFSSNQEQIQSFFDEKSLPERLIASDSDHILSEQPPAELLSKESKESKIVCISSFFNNNGFLNSNQNGSVPLPSTTV